MIGRALVGSAGMLLLDEPSNALDLAAQAELRGLMRKLAQQGTGIMLITHHIADIPPEIDRILMMREGRIIADGSKEELLTAERLSDLFKTEVQLSERDGFFHALVMRCPAGRAHFAWGGHFVTCVPFLADLVAGPPVGRD